MPLTALFARCLLALALVTNGLPAMAMPAEADASSAAAVSAPCHDEPGASSGTEASALSPTSLDCCEGGDCTCSCLHHAPLVLAFAAVPTVMPPSEGGVPPSAGIPPGPQRPPSLRPPIPG